MLCESYSRPGFVACVPKDLAVVLTNDIVIQTTEADLTRTDILNWVMGELQIEGPTAREALFLRARDGLGPDDETFFLHGRIDPTSLDDESRTFSTRMLGPYDPSFDYGPWIDQCRRPGKPVVPTSCQATS